MGSVVARPDREFHENGSEPEFFVSYTRVEAAAPGLVRIFCYAERRKGQFHLVYTALVPSAALAIIGRKSVEVSTEARNLETWETDTTCN